MARRAKSTRGRGPLLTCAGGRRRLARLRPERPPKRRGRVPRKSAGRESWRLIRMRTDGRPILRRVACGSVPLAAVLICLAGCGDGDSPNAEPTPTPTPVCGGVSFQKLHDFDGANGKYPMGSLAQGSDGTLYGAATQGASDQGLLFKMNTDGTGFAAVQRFASASGSYPRDALWIAGQTLIGTTQMGGVFNRGVVYRVQTDGTGFQLLHSFAGDGTAGLGLGLTFFSMNGRSSRSAPFSTRPHGGLHTTSTGPPSRSSCTEPFSRSSASAPTCLYLAVLYALHVVACAGVFVLGTIGALGTIGRTRGRVDRAAPRGGGSRTCLQIGDRFRWVYGSRHMGAGILHKPPTRARRAGVAVLLTVSLASSGIGLTFCRGRNHGPAEPPLEEQWTWLGIPVAAFAVWFIPIGRTGIGVDRQPMTLETLKAIPWFVVGWLCERGRGDPRNRAGPWPDRRGWSRQSPPCA